MKQHRRTRSQALAAILVAALASVGLAAPVDAQAGPPPGEHAEALFEVGPAIAADDATVRASRQIDLNADALEPGEPELVSLDLHGTTRVADLEPVESGTPGWDAWTGTVDGDPNSSASFVRRGVDISGLVSTTTGSYRIRNVGAGDHVTELIGSFPEGPDTMVPPSSGGDPVGQDDLHDHDHEAAPAPAPAAGADQPDVSGDDPPVIDVLMAYTPAALSAAGSLNALQAEAALAISTTNTAYANSGVVGSVRLAGLHALSTNLTLSTTSLNQLTNTDGVDDSVHAARNNVSADMVAALVVDPSSCGLAWVRNQASFAAYSFSLTAYNCAVSNLSFPHELGHNMGLNHDRYVSIPGGEYYPYAYGHVNTTARWRTIMAYNNQCGDLGFNCTRLSRFSNPDQTHNGAPLGIVWTDASAADSRRALNASLPSIQNFRIPNRVPVANGQSVSVVHRVAKAIALTGSDADGDALTYTVVSGPSKGTLSGTAPNLTYTPASGQVGSDSFTFRVSDGKVNSAAATVSITISNTVPVATGQSVSTAYETAKAITVSGSDADGNSLTYAVTSSPSHGTVSGTAPFLTYTPPAGWSGTTSFTFTVSDGAATSAAATVNVTVQPKPNTVPVANGQSVSVTHRVARAITLTGSDADGDALTYTVMSNPSKGTLSGTAPNVVYTPTIGEVGSDSFTFRVSDGKANSTTATVSITITNAVPAATPASVTTPYGTARAITLAGTDPDGNSLTYAVASNPSHGTLTGTAPNLTYTPPVGWSGTTSFTFTVSDGAATSAPATVTITVDPKPNTVPVATGQSVAVTHRVARAITLTGSDADGDALTYTVTSNPSKGTLSGTAPNVVYTPASGEVGTDSFTFRVSDGKANSATATVSITITNQAPTATGASVTTPFESARAITLAGTDPDGNSLTYAVASNPSHGTLTGTAPNLTYTPAVGWSGTTSFTFRVSDGAATSAPATVTVTVDPKPNAIPIAIGQSVTVKPQVASSITLTGTDADGDALTYTVLSDPSRGTLSGTAPNLIYTPTAGQVGSDSFTFRVSDGEAKSATATVTITIPAWWAPWSSSTAAIGDLYRWFTGAGPTTAQRNSAAAAVSNGATTGDLVAGLRTASDATTNVDPAARLYAAYFVRIPDAGGLNYWIGKRRQGTTLSSISSTFAASSEFRNRYGNLSNRAFVELVYRNVLGRAGDAGGINYWTGRLDRRVSTRGQVMLGFSESNEYRVGQVANVHAAATYVQLLGRAPTVAERDAFVAALAASTPLGRLADELIATPTVASRAG